MDVKPVFIFSQLKEVRGWFTHKNADSVNRDGVIPGLNCGLKTEAPAEETEANRQKLFRHLNLDPERVVLGEQVHGTRVVEVTGGGIHPDTDGFVTRERGLTLAIQVADCAAILVADIENGVIGAAHAGWRGAADGIARNLIEWVRKLGSGGTDGLYAYISPNISLPHFEVGEEVASLFPDDWVERKRYDNPHIDLRAFLRNELREAGVPDYQIETDSGCTFEDADRYYSWRREKERSGRMLAMIQLQPSK